MKKELRADIHFDLICPWCLIGKRQFERALGLLADRAPALRVDVCWHGVQLLPAVPAQGLDFREFYARRLGGEAAVRTRQAQVLAAAEHAGVELAFDRIRTMPNTEAAHRVLAWTRPNAGNALHLRLLERLFAAYFQQGEDIGDRAVLQRIARDAGIDPEPLAECWSARFDWESSPAPGGVPLFVFDDRVVVAGAQPAEVLVAAMQRAAASDAEGAA